ncbi:MAG TPA: heavy-metal-associated domain-containing protein [Armatimonadota bacterium]|nr:heavy-metal-associated domain-containing protein [Armatimonadota bacterium]
MSLHERGEKEQMQQVEWTVGGIQCEGCAKSIRSALSRLDGVQEVSVDVAAKH